MGTWGTHLQVGRPGNEACVGGRAIPTGLQLQRASLPNVTWSPGHTEPELRTGRGATHAWGVMGTNAGIVEGDHGMRRGPPTNSGESAEVNGQVSKQGTSLGPPSQPLCPCQGYIFTASQSPLALGQLSPVGSSLILSPPLSLEPPLSSFGLVLLVCPLPAPFRSSPLTRPPWAAMPHCSPK